MSPHSYFGHMSIEASLTCGGALGRRARFKLNACSSKTARVGFLLSDSHHSSGFRTFIKLDMCKVQTHSSPAAHVVYPLAFLR